MVVKGGIINQQLQDYARQQIKDGLTQCTEAQQKLFKRMYSHNNLNLPINEVVNNMPEDKLEVAMDQVQRTIKKNQARQPAAVV